MEFKIGDVVKLKAGGPHMTVEGFAQKQRNATNSAAQAMIWDPPAPPPLVRPVQCVWFANNNDPSAHRDTFEEDCLRVADVSTAD